MHLWFRMLLLIHSGANILPWWETRENRDHRAGASLWAYGGKRNRNYAVWGVGELPSIFIHFYYFYVKGNSLPGLAGLLRTEILASCSPKACLYACTCVCRGLAGGPDSAAFYLLPFTFMSSALSCECNEPFNHVTFKFQNSVFRREFIIDLFYWNTCKNTKRSD